MTPPRRRSRPSPSSARRAPRFAGWSLAAAQSVVDGAPEIAVVGPAGPARDDLERRARRGPVRWWPSSDGPRRGVPLLTGRDAVARKSAAYVCRATFVTVPWFRPAKSRSRRWTAHLVCSRPRPGGAANQNEDRRGGHSRGRSAPHLTGRAGPQTSISRRRRTDRRLRARRRRGPRAALISRVVDDEWLEVMAVSGEPSFGAVDRRAAGGVPTSTPARQRRAARSAARDQAPRALLRRGPATTCRRPSAT